MASLKENEYIGKDVERKIADQFISQGLKVSFPEDPHAHFDFQLEGLTPMTSFCEVKSCQFKIKNGFYINKNGEKTTNDGRFGRFFIHGYSHDVIKELIENGEKTAFYIFVVVNKQGEILKQKQLTWLEVDSLLHGKKPIGRGDFMVEHPTVFHCEGEHDC